MKQKFLYTTLALFAATALLAQKSEFNVNAGGGLSTLQYNVDNGTHKMGFGGTAGLGYTYFFNSHWGLGTGVELNWYNAKAELDNGFSRTYNTVAQTPGADNTMEYTYSVSGYSEKQSALYFSIPLLLQFQTGDKHKFYAQAGGRIGFPVSATYSSDPATVATQGHFPAEGLTYYDLPRYGFGTFNEPAGDGDLDLKVSFMLSLEAGMKWKVGERSVFYTGVYFDYGLNDVKDPGAQEMVAYNGNNAPAMHALLASSHNSTSMIETIRPMAVGVKLRFAFGFSPKSNPATAVSKIQDR